MQSLKNLTDANALPMVAVRSAGLAFESLIGRVAAPARDFGSDNDNNNNNNHDGGDEGGNREVIEALVSEEYLEILMGIANARFAANGERMRRFERLLFNRAGDGDSGSVDEGWEDGAKRRERKRAEGLRRREEVKGEDREEEVVLGDGDLEALG